MADYGGYYSNTYSGDGSNYNYSSDSSGAGGGGPDPFQPQTSGSDNSGDNTSGDSGAGSFNAPGDITGMGFGGAGQGPGGGFGGGGGGYYPGGGGGGGGFSGGGGFGGGGYPGGGFGGLGFGGDLGSLAQSAGFGSSDPGGFAMSPALAGSEAVAPTLSAWQQQAPGQITQGANYPSNRQTDSPTGTQSGAGMSFADQLMSILGGVNPISSAQAAEATPQGDLTGSVPPSRSLYDTSALSPANQAASDRSLILQNLGMGDTLTSADQPPGTQLPTGGGATGVGGVASGDPFAGRFGGLGQFAPSSGGPVSTTGDITNLGFPGGSGTVPPTETASAGPQLRPDFWQAPNAPAGDSFAARAGDAGQFAPSSGGPVSTTGDITNLGFPGGSGTVPPTATASAGSPLGPSFWGPAPGATANTAPPVPGTTGDTATPPVPGSPADTANLALDPSDPVLSQQTGPTDPFPLNYAPAEPALLANPQNIGDPTQVGNTPLPRAAPGQADAGGGPALTGGATPGATPVSTVSAGGAPAAPADTAGPGAGPGSGGFDQRATSDQRRRGGLHNVIAQMFGGGTLGDTVASLMLQLGIPAALIMASRGGGGAGLGMLGGRAAMSGAGRVGGFAPQFARNMFPGPGVPPWLIPGVAGAMVGQRLDQPPQQPPQDHPPVNPGRPPQDQPRVLTPPTRSDFATKPQDLTGGGAPGAGRTAVSPFGAGSAPQGTMAGALPARQPLIGPVPPIGLAQAGAQNGAIAYIQGRGGHPAGQGAPDLNPQFAARVAQAAQAYEAETGRPAQFGEMGRSRALQAQYYDEFRRTGQGRAAPPGQSRHEQGTAIDIPNGDFQNWMHRNASKFGLKDLRPELNDPNHFQMA